MTCAVSALLIMSGGFLLLARYHRKCAEENAAQALDNLNAAKENREQAQTNNKNAELNAYIADTLYGVTSRQN